MIPSPGTQAPARARYRRLAALAVAAVVVVAVALGVSSNRTNVAASTPTTVSPASAREAGQACADFAQLLRDVQSGAVQGQAALAGRIATVDQAAGAAANASSAWSQLAQDTHDLLTDVQQSSPLINQAASSVQTDCESVPTGTGTQT